MDSKVTNFKPRVLIVGGSLGGLFAAVSLRAIGWEVEVYERSPHALDSRGGGIVLQPEVLSVFDAARVPYPPQLGVVSRDRIYLNRDDEVSSRAPMPQTQTSWNTLYNTMRRHLPEGVVHAGETLARFEQDGLGVTAYFESGLVAQGDLLIGADGARSTVRLQLLPWAAPTYAGYVAWRGLAPELALPEQVARKLDDSFAFQQGADHMLLQYLVPGEDESLLPGRRRRNWVWYRKVAEGAELAETLTDRDGLRRTHALPPGSVSDAAVRELKAAAASQLAPSLRAVVDATAEPFVQAMLDLQVRKMVFGRVILVGDAAFVPRPHTAGSTAKAAANALALATALRQATLSTLDATLARWQSFELLNGARMTDWGREIGDRIMGITRAGSAPADTRLTAAGPRPGMY